MRFKKTKTLSIKKEKAYTNAIEQIQKVMLLNKTQIITKTK